MLDKGIFNEYEKCLQDEPAATTARCPVHVDVPEFCAQMAAGNFKAAYGILQKRIPFASIFCLVCDAPCETVCVRNALDAAVSIGELERAAVRYGYTPYKKKFKTSKRGGRVAVVGGGISGLAAAFDLDRRGYAVTIYEQSRQLGGWLWELEDKGLTHEDITTGLEAIYELAIEVRYGQLIDTAGLQQLLGEYDAVYLGTGSWPETLSVEPNTFRVGGERLCAGGGLASADESLINAVSSGKRAAITLERIIKGVSITGEREREGAFETLLKKSLEGVRQIGTVPICLTPSSAQESSGAPQSVACFSPEEAQQEAARCLLCECDECLKACAHMQRYGRKPKTYAREIYTNENVFLGTRYANKMINSCTLCGLCGERCPLDINMAPLVHQTRQSMVNSEKMPPSAHDFALRDMAFSNGELSALVRQPPELLAAQKVDEQDQSSASDKAPWMYVPGCQLAASAPEHVEASYAWLRDTLPEGVALFLGCCGAPADWAGRDDLLQKTLSSIRSVWELEGNPVFICACSSCSDIFERYLPEIETVSLWHLLSKKELPSSAAHGAGITLNIHDACRARHDVNLQQDVRLLLDTLGYTVEELRYAQEDTKCCGYGGLVFYANREQEGDFALDRAKESPHDLLVYCAMCKDLFIDAGKRSFHLLDLLFAEDSEAYALKRMPTLSERQVNRAELKQRLLHEVWGEDSLSPGAAVPGFTVTISPEVLALMDERLILVSDVEDALARAINEPDERFYNTEEECYLISIRKQYVTYWVRYKQTSTELEVQSAYSHRMDITGQKESA